jgi:hypothetical protein
VGVTAGTAAVVDGLELAAMMAPTEVTRAQWAATGMMAGPEYMTAVKAPQCHLA